MDYTDEQINNLHNAMNSTFEDNMNFFKIINNNLYNKLQNFSLKLENNEVKSHYEIEFKNSSFDIYDKKNKVYLYNKTQTEYSNEALQSIDKTQQNTFNDLPTLLYNIKNPNSSRLFNDDINTYSAFKITNDVYKFRKIFNYFKIEDKREFKTIPTFIFFGTLLGNHLIDIHKKVKAQSYLVVEPNLEIFRLSLFVTEYKLLAQYSDIFFCIEEDDLGTISYYERFIDSNYLNNYIFKYYSTSQHDIKLLHQFTVALQNRSSTAYDHYRQLYYAKNSIQNINKYKLLNSNNANSSLTDKPVLILSPGPSLRAKSKWLKKNKDRFILVAFGATIKALCDLNIKPDIIISVDASTLIINQFPKKCSKIFKNSLAFLTTDCHPKVFTFFKKKNIFVFETNFKFSSNGINEAPSTTVGDNTLHILLSLGFTQIYLLGTDLCFDIQTGSSYDKTHIQSKTKHNIDQYKKNIKKITNKINLKSEYIATKANFGKHEVYSNNFFLQIIKNYHLIINYHNRDKKFDIFNLSDGAFIPGSIALKINNIQEFKKIKQKKDTLKKILKGKSSLYFTNDDFNKFTNEIIFLEDLLKDINSLKIQENIVFEEFYQFSIIFSKKILSYNSYSQLLLSLTFGYMKTINNYINYYFNTTSSIPKHIINEIKDLWCHQIGSILSEYIDILKLPNKL